MFRRILVPAVVIAAIAVALQASYAATLPTHPAATPKISFGPSHDITMKAFNGYYDAHLDEYINTDVSSKSQATAFHLNYSAAIGKDIANTTSPMYFVVGRSAKAQLAIFGSEPGEMDYSPLWQEFIVKWKPGVKPFVLKSDNAVAHAKSKGKVTVKATKIVINSPITKVAGM